MMRSRSAETESLGYARPGSYEELRAVLASGSMRLPKRLRQVAVFLWQHPSDVALGTTVSVSSQAGVQPSTLVRFAKHLGYAGFSDLQALFKEYIKGSRPALPAAAKRANGKAENGQAGNRALVAGFLQAAEDALRRTADDFDLDRFESMVDMLAAADIIYLVGSKRAFPVTTYMSIALAKVGIRNVLVDNIGSAAFDQIGWLADRDVLLAVSFSPYNSITADLAAIAHQRNIPVAAITDSALSPLLPLSAEWLEVVENDFAGFRSLGATIAITLALVLAIAEKRERPGGKAKARLRTGRVT
jgi:DNA-binding MurR/RpiR family transcriptional regulator